MAQHGRHSHVSKGQRLRRAQRRKEEKATTIVQQRATEKRLVTRALNYLKRYDPQTESRTMQKLQLSAVFKDTVIRILRACLGEQPKQKPFAYHNIASAIAEAAQFSRPSIPYYSQADIAEFHEYTTSRKRA